MHIFKDPRCLFIAFFCLLPSLFLPVGRGLGEDCEELTRDKYVFLPNNTSIRVKVYVIKLPKEGTPVKARVFESVYVENREVIRANAPVEAYIRGSGVAKMVDFVSVEAVDGQIIGLRSLSDNPKKYMAGKVGVSALFGLSSLVGLRDSDDKNENYMDRQRDKYDEPNILSESYGKALVDGDYSVMTLNPYGH